MGVSPKDLCDFPFKINHTSGIKPASNTMMSNSNYWDTEETNNSDSQLKLPSTKVNPADTLEKTEPFIN